MSIWSSGSLGSSSDEVLSKDVYALFCGVSVAKIALSSSIISDKYSPIEETLRSEIGAGVGTTSFSSSDGEMVELESSSFSITKLGSGDVVGKFVVGKFVVGKDVKVGGMEEMTVGIDDGAIEKPMVGDDDGDTERLTEGDDVAGPDRSKDGCSEFEGEDEGSIDGATLGMIDPPWPPFEFLSFEGRLEGGSVGNAVGNTVGDGI